jgi:hypothetical protein
MFNSSFLPLFSWGFSHPFWVQVKERKAPEPELQPLKPSTETGKSRGIFTCLEFGFKHRFYCLLMVFPTTKTGI